MSPSAFDICRQSAGPHRSIHARMFSWRCHSDTPADGNRIIHLCKSRQIEDNRDDPMRKPLLALAVSAFGIGTSEFIIMGLLPNLAHSFRVSIPKTGILVSGYALSVTLGSPLVALALSRMDRKRALLILMGMFLAGNALCALAPTFLLLLCARILTALCHGAFFGIGSIVAAHLVPRSERAQAIALMFTGLTLANVLGVPAGTALGQAFGWRFAFWAIVPIGLLAASAVFFLVPKQAPGSGGLLHEFRVLRKPQVLLVLAMSILTSASLFC